MAIIQWNMNGFYSHLAELQHIISKIDPLFICIQETRFAKDQIGKLRNYNTYQKNRTDATIASGGVAIFSKNNIACEQLDLNTELEAIAIRTYMYNYKRVTICCLYLPPNVNFTSQQLENLITQLPTPFIVTGDFNGHNHIWGSTHTETRGRKIEKIITDNLTLLNDGSHTHFCTRTGSFSSIDLSICDASLAADLTWDVIKVPWGDGHFPIKISFPSDPNIPTNLIKKWALHRADWTDFRRKCETSQPIENSNIDLVVETFTTQLINAAEETIGYKKPPNRRKNVPWWNKDCDRTTKELKKSLNRYRKSPTMDNLTNLKKSRAMSRRTILNSKKTAWELFTSTITTSTPPSVVWDKIRKIRGHKTNTISSTLIKNDQIITCPQQVTETLANTFQSNSSDDNYMPEFLNYKNQIENSDLLTDNDNSDLNRPFSRQELDHAINNLKDKKSPGPDGIPSEIIKQLPDVTLKQLLKIYNQIWATGTYPKKWQEVNTFPIPKDNRNKTNPDKYRPISASNILSKVLQTMTNNRLVWFLEKNNFFNNVQSGFRRGRSTLDHIMSLNADVQKSFKNRQSLIAVFFDIKKAYDMTWRYHILRTLKTAGINGHMFNYIKNFLQDRRFRVVANGHYSTQKIQSNGVPQGEVISVTLFLVAINNLISSLPPGTKTCLFADDLVVYINGKNLRTLQIQIQNAIKNLEDYSNTTGFCFSSEKTKAVHFNRRQYNRYNPRLTLYNKPIQYVNQIKFLGVIFDSKLTWKQHINNLKKECYQRMNLLKALGHQKWGSSKDILIRIYQSLIRSKLDYGCAAYENTKPSRLKLLEPIQNTALRIAIGALRTSPIDSILEETNQLPLSYRRTQISISYITNLAANPSNSTFQHFFSLNENNNSPEILHSNLPYQQNITKHLHDINTTLPTQILQNHYNTIPPWTLKKPSFNLSLTKFQKKNSHPQTYLNQYAEYISRQSKFTAIYTDGSKIENNIGAAIIVGNNTYTYRLPVETSVYTAEAYAMLQATQHILNSEEERFIIHSDSLSVIQAIQKPYNRHPTIQRIQDNLHKSIEKNKKITILWIPSHVGVQGNEDVDAAAKRAASLDVVEDVPVPVADIKNHIKNKLKQKWRNYWNTLNHNKYQNIKPNSTPWPVPNNRRDQVIISRMRIGHTLFTHEFIFKRADPPQCEVCGETLTVQHILVNCPQYKNQRQINNLPTTLKDALSKNEEIERTIKFLKDIKLYEKI